VLAVLVTIVLGSSVYIQGIFECRLDNGMVTVRVGDRLFTGRPANSATAA
jgi:hypothetical protein